MTRAKRCVVLILYKNQSHLWIFQSPDAILTTQMKTFVIGDIHGAYKALLQCLQRSGFDYQNDRLIALGDVCDGYPEVHLCIDELLRIKFCAYIIGNHDLWALDWALHGKAPQVWTSQGGVGTMFSYNNRHTLVPKAHVDFLLKAYSWFELQGKIFVHGGFDPNFSLNEQDRQKFIWDRDLLRMAYRTSLQDSSHKFSKYEEIFLGHTPTGHFESTMPVHFCNVWGIDTGAGWSGLLTIMDVYSKQFWQSDETPKLYPGVHSR